MVVGVLEEEEDLREVIPVVCRSVLETTLSRRTYRQTR